jgi:hypothetical protein
MKINEKQLLLFFMNGLAVEVNLYDFIKYIRISYKLFSWGTGKLEFWSIGVMKK